MPFGRKGLRHGFLYTTPTPPAPAPTGLLAGKALLLAAGLVAGGFGGALLQARYGTPREVVVERRIEVQVPSPEVRVPSPAAAAPAVETSRPRAVERRPPPPASAIDLERLLIEQATSALSRRQADQTLAACAQHATQFPAGQLAEERESLAIRALASVGRMDEARARAEKFRAQFPGGLLLEVVNAAVRDTPSP